MTWAQLEAAATSDRLRIHRSSRNGATYGVTIYTTDMMASEMLTISAGDLDDADADKALRSMTAFALATLKAMNP
jgi:hypothetical protein